MAEDGIEMHGTMLLTKPQIAAPIEKISRSIDSLLEWAYSEELPKAPPSSSQRNWRSIVEYGSRGGIDVGQSSAARYTHYEEPHPDARIIEAAVNALPDMAINWKRDFDLIAHELAPLVSINELIGKPTSAPLVSTAKAGFYDDPANVPAPPKRDIILVNTIKTEVLIYTHAVQGTRPGNWRANDMQAIPTPAERGPLAKIIGICKGKNSYTSGSYCPLRWMPSPVKIVLARANYITWHRALVTLAETLQLAEHIPAMPNAPATPWIDEGPKHWLIGPIKRAKRNPLPLKPPRKRAGPKETPPRYPGRRVGP